MAVDYYLFLDGPGTQQSLWQELLSLGPVSVPGYSLPAADWHGIRVIQAPVNATDQELLDGALGIQAHSSLSFRPDFLVHEDPFIPMISLVASLLQRTRGDGAFTHETEVAWLLRRNGRLVLDSEGDFWRPELLNCVAQVGLAFDRVPLKSRIRRWEDEHPSA